MAAKVVNWTKIPLAGNPFVNRQFGRFNHQKWRIYSTLYKGDTWAVFPTHFYLPRWKSSVSRYATHVVGVESKVALEQKVIARPETWKKSSYYR